MLAGKGVPAVAVSGLDFVDQAIRFCIGVGDFWWHRCGISAVLWNVVQEMDGRMRSPDFYAFVSCPDSNPWANPMRPGGRT